MREGLFCERLMCRWLSWRVGGDFHLVLDLPELNCTDMTGCIRTAQLLMPDVCRIEVLSGGEPDTLYLMVNDGGGGSVADWKAIDTRKRMQGA